MALTSPQVRDKFQKSGLERFKVRLCADASKTGRKMAVRVQVAFPLPVSSQHLLQTYDSCVVGGGLETSPVFVVYSL